MRPTIWCLDLIDIWHDLGLDLIDLVADVGLGPYYGVWGEGHGQWTKTIGWIRVQFPLKLRRQVMAE